MAEAFKRLVKLAARAFYDDIIFKGDSQRKAGRSDDSGLGVVVLDALTSRQWVREDDLARSLKVHSKQLRRILRFFEEEKFVNRCHRKETIKSSKIPGDGLELSKEGDGKMKIHTHSYCCLDYAQIYDVVRYRLHRMKKKLKDELEDKKTVQAYICPDCSRRYSAFDALELVSLDDDYFHCELCNSILIAESQKINSEDICKDGEEGSRARHREKLRDRLHKMEEQLKPLTIQLARVKDLPAPEFGTLQSWEARVNATRSAAASNVIMVDFSKSDQALECGVPSVPRMGETKVCDSIAGKGYIRVHVEKTRMLANEIEVRMSNANAVEEVKPAEATEPAKIAPPWLTKPGKSLAREKASTSSALLEDKQEEMKESAKSLQEEYVAAYYEAYARMQTELLMASGKKEEENETSEASAGMAFRRVGVKSNREELEWEEDVVDQLPGTTISEEVLEEELDWEEG